MNESGRDDFLPAVRGGDEILLGAVRETREWCIVQERDIKSSVEPPTTPFPHRIIPDGKLQNVPRSLNWCHPFSERKELIDSRCQSSIVKELAENSLSKKDRLSGAI